MPKQQKERMNKTERELIQDGVPELWRQRRNAGLCPVCGKSRQEFATGMIVYCSVEHRDEYAKQFTFWTDLRWEVLERDHRTCQVCGLTQDKYDEQKSARRQSVLNDQFKEWVAKPENRSYFDTLRDKALIELSEDFERQYRKIMDDIEFFDRKVRWKDGVDIPSSKDESFHLEVDHIVALVNGGAMWDKSNLRTICNFCHHKKTAEDIKTSKQG